MPASFGLSELFIALIEGFGAPRPASFGPGELYEALVLAVQNFVVGGSITNPSITYTPLVATLPLASYNLDWNQARVQDLTMTQNTSFTLVNMVPSRYLDLTLRGSFTPSFPNVTAWLPTGSAPVYSDTGNGVSYRFWMTELGEIRGATISTIPAGTYDAAGSAAAVQALCVLLAGSVMTGRLSTAGLVLGTTQSTAIAYLTLSTDGLIFLTGTTASLTLTLGTTGFISGQVQAVRNNSNQTWTIAAHSGTTDVTSLAAGAGLITAFNGTNWYAIGSH